MTLSIEVLPAPFGPMMARISPLRMSNETSVIAFTPPKDSDTFSTERSNRRPRCSWPGRRSHAAFSIAGAATGSVVMSRILTRADDACPCGRPRR